MNSGTAPSQPAFHPAARISSIGVSEILTITARAVEMKRAGKPVIILGAGEPDFDTPEHIKDAAAKAMRDGATKYTALDGTAELKQAIREKFVRDNELDYAVEEITVSAGAKQVIYNALMATLDPGDEVIIPTPYWVSYSDIVQICGGNAVLLPCREEDGFRLQPADLEGAITARTRWLILNSPSNPSGAAYRTEDYQPLLGVLKRHPHVWLMVDDMYEHIVYDDFHFSTPAQIESALKERTLTINGVSKAYAMTGWRIGYGGGPRALIRAMAIVQSQSTSCASSVSQAAAVEALLGPQEFIYERSRSFQNRRDLVVDALNEIGELSCRRPEGAFYAFVNCSGLIGRNTPGGDRITSDRDFTQYLLESQYVAVVPGSAFGLAPFFRISYATSEQELRTALARIQAACETLR